jgi:hypothetical protein
VNRGSKRIADLSLDEKRALLMRLLQKKASESKLFLDQLGITVTELEAEAALDPTIRPEAIPVEPETEPAHIFLTGATGFLGSFLLHELLDQTQAEIYCLVRSANVEEGKQKLYKTLAAYGLWREELSPRIVPIVGDLSAPLLGLSEHQFRMLAGKVDAIYHNGALVNWISSYHQLIRPMFSEPKRSCAWQVATKSSPCISFLPSPCSPSLPVLRRRLFENRTSSIMAACSTVAIRRVSGWQKS